MTPTKPTPELQSAIYPDEVYISEPHMEMGALVDFGCGSYYCKLGGTLTDISEGTVLYLRADRHPDRQLIEQLRHALGEAWSVISSINASRHHKVMIEGAECYWQTDDWVKWAKEEILPIIEKARATGEGV